MGSSGDSPNELALSMDPAGLASSACCITADNLRLLWVGTATEGRAAF